MNVRALVVLLVASCASLKEAPSTLGPDASWDAGSGVASSDAGSSGALAVDAGQDARDAVTDSGAVQTTDGSSVVTWSVTPIVKDRHRLGARSSAGFRPWRTGVALRSGKVFWVEGGNAPGLYAMPLGCSSAACIQTVEALTKPTAFAASSSYVYVANATVIRRYAVADDAAQAVASDSSEIPNLAADDDAAYWTAGDDTAIRKSPLGGPATTLIHSNGSPVSMGVAGARVWWEGVDISGNNGALQDVGTDGSSPAAVKTFSTGFGAVGGDSLYLYWATSSELHRRTLQTGHDEVVATDTSGVNDIAVDSEAAYWVELGDAPDYLNGRLRRIAHGSTDVETLAVSLTLPIAVAVDGAKVAVLSAGTSAASYADGAILLVTPRS